MAITNGLPSFKPHVIFYGRYALDAARDADRFVNVFLGIDKAAELHDTLESFNIDLRRF